jgi:putative addiction module component (TIGR02574 family)
LAGSLIESLDSTVDGDAEAEWDQEIARRIEDLDAGKAKTVPWEAVRSRISSKLT